MNIQASPFIEMIYQFSDIDKQRLANYYRQPFRFTLLAHDAPLGVTEQANEPKKQADNAIMFQDFKFVHHIYKDVLKSQLSVLMIQDKVTIASMTLKGGLITIEKYCVKGKENTLVCRPPRSVEDFIYMCRHVGINLYFTPQYVNQLNIKTEIEIKDASKTV